MTTATIIMLFVFLTVSVSLPANGENPPAGMRLCGERGERHIAMPAEFGRTSGRRRRLPRLDENGPACPICAPAQPWPKGWSGAQVLTVLCLCLRRRQAWSVYSEAELSELFDTIPHR